MLDSPSWTLQRHMLALSRLVLLTGLILLAACDSTSEPPLEERTGRGSVVAATVLETVTKAEINALGFPIAALYDVEIHSIQYRTIDIDGAETIASGAVLVPKGARTAVPLATYLHGTVVRKDGVASVGGMDVLETLIGVLFASTGYLTAMPDYLGLGTSAGLHPYVHAASLASASVDMLLATEVIAQREDIDLNGQLFVTGYSEGGYAAAATQRLLEDEYSAELPITASAPMAGPYDMSGIMADLMLAREAFSNPYYLPYTLLAYDAVYDIFDTPSDIFVDPFDATIPPLFDGLHGSSEINAALPDVPIDIVRPEYTDAFSKNADHPFRVALRENDLYDWAPRAPTRLYHCIDDDLVPFANSQRAFDAFRANGASQVQLIPLNDGGHVDCVIPALTLAKLWFDTFRASKDATAP